MTMTRLFRRAMFLCMLSLAGCVTIALAPQAAAQSQKAEAFKAWVLRVNQHIRVKIRYPPSSIARREEGNVEVAFTIDRQGRLIRSRVARSSGFAALDKAALDLLRQAQPLPPPPAALSPPPHINLTLPVNYRLGRCGPLDRLFRRCT
jgi:periplasmic protein TonB